MTSTYTLDLAKIGRSDLALVGGKAAHLGELITAGFPVPSGFVVTTAADLESRDEPAVPLHIAAEIRAQYARLGSPAVAVRSSATAEDTADASFAGQHDTFLNVSGADDVLQAVRDCWASLWSPRAVAYRREHHWDDSDLAIAVVVQTMVDAEWAGVMFTADPVTGKRDRIVVEAVRGLGEALVSGETSGRRFVVDKHTRRATGTTEPLPPGLLADLADLGVRVEAAFGGAPQDIEWVFADGRCSLVQARPLTALPPEPTSTRRRRRPDHRLIFVADHLPRPPYPLDVSFTLRPAVTAILDGLRTAGFAAPGPHEVLTEIGEGVVQFAPPAIRPTPRVLLRLPRSLAWLIRGMRVTPEAWLARCRSTLLPLIERSDTTDVTTSTDDELLDAMAELRRCQAELTPTRFTSAIPRVVLADAVLRRLLRLTLGRKAAVRAYADLHATIPSITKESNQDLEQLAAMIRADEDLRRAYADRPDAIVGRLQGFESGRRLLEEIDEYLRRFGCRQVVAPLIGFPPLRETPEVLHGMLANLAKSPPRVSDDSPDRSDDVMARLTSGPGLRRGIFGPIAARLVDAVRAGVSMRENSHFWLFMAASAANRRYVLEIGRRLRERGVLDQPTDVLYLAWDELHAPVTENTRKLVQRRRAAREAAEPGYTMFAPEHLGTRDADATVLRGVPASRGTAVGRVRIVRSEQDFGRLQPGEVLVCPYTNPAWTPLFSLASAVVADVGGLSSHAAIVAREYGIPAVMATTHGTTVLRDGQEVRVDGDAGIVTPIGS